MATGIPSQQDLYDKFKNEAQSREPGLTDFEDGSKLDSISGAASVAGEELTRFIIEKFNKTFFNTAHGPEVTGGPDDLELLATDHFGDSFARPAASFSVTPITFSRPTTTAGNVVIPAGTIVKTIQNANGVDQRFATDAEVTLIGLSIGASVTAVVAGTDGNVNIGKITIIEDALTDGTVTVTNATAASGGTDEATDAEYREFIRNKVETIRGATKAAIEAAAKTVPGIVIATAIEDTQVVIEWDIATSMTVGDFFRIPRVRLFVADVNGTANQALIDLVDIEVEATRACGVRITVESATPLSQDWDASISLNPSGPNFALLSTDVTILLDSMEDYINELPIGTDFVRATAEAAILAIWGPAGTDDLTVFTTNVPTGTVDADVTEKLIAGTMSIS